MDAGGLLRASTGPPIEIWFAFMNSKKKTHPGSGCVFLVGKKRLLTREEREADQDADQVGSAAAETMRVVGFHARREAAIRER
jgi:hypothetical protein